MADGEGGYQDEDPFVVAEGIQRCQHQDEQLVIQCIQTNDMFPAQAEIEPEISHVQRLLTFCIERASK